MQDESVTGDRLQDQLTRAWEWTLPGRQSAMRNELFRALHQRLRVEESGPYCARTAGGCSSTPP